MQLCPVVQMEPSQTAGPPKLPNCALSQRKNSLLREIRQRGAVVRCMSPENQVRVGQYGATINTDSLFSLTLHNICRLTRGNAYFEGPGGRAEGGPSQGIPQWAMGGFLGSKQVYLHFAKRTPDQLD